MNTKQKIKLIVTNKEQRTKAITFTTMLYNFLWSIGKIVVGVLTTSLFFCISGAYTLLIAFIKRIFLVHNKSENEELKYNKSLSIGIIIIIVGTLFTFYMTRLFFVPDKEKYGRIVSIAIATFAFVELGIAIYNFIKAQKNKDMLLSSLRACNIVSSCYAIVLTQAALLSAAGSTNNSLYNGITGTIFGAVSIAIGTYIIVKSCKMKRKLMAIE